MINIIELNNCYSTNYHKEPSIIEPDYPRIQVNKHGEIILALGKEGILTRGILIAKTPECKKPYKLGLYMEDWEVTGELVDYSGGVTITLLNKWRN